MARQGHIALAILLVVAALGFLLGDGRSDPPPAASVTAAPGGITAPTIDPQQPVDEPQTAAETVRVYAHQLLNWDPSTFLRQHERAAQMAAREATRRHHAALTDQDVLAEVQARGAGSRARVLSVRRTGPGKFLVVARVELFGEGSSAPPMRRRYVAAVAKINATWKVVEWNPIQ